MHIGSYITLKKESGLFCNFGRRGLFSVLGAGPITEIFSLMGSLPAIYLVSDHPTNDWSQRQ